MNQDACIADCVLEAGTMLQSSLERLENGEPLDEQAGAAAAAKPDPIDPDDLAAAFFAQQARKQQEETRIPVNEWAKTIFAHAERKATMREGASPSLLQASTTISREEMVNELFLEFQNGVKDYKR
jgi:hypothetical protein